MASMEELYNTIADIWDSYDMYRQEHADKYGEAEESPSTIEQIKRHFYYVEKNKAGGLIPKIKNKINLDLELKETDSPEERSDKLWLLEQIYVAEKYRTAGTGVFEPMQGSGYYRKPERDVCVQ